MSHMLRQTKGKHLTSHSMNILRIIAILIFSTAATLAANGFQEGGNYAAYEAVPSYGDPDLQYHSYSPSSGGQAGNLPEGYVGDYVYGEQYTRSYGHLFNNPFWLMCAVSSLLQALLGTWFAFTGKSRSEFAAGTSVVLFAVFALGALTALLGR